MIPLVLSSFKECSLDKTRDGDEKTGSNRDDDQALTMSALSEDTTTGVARRRRPIAENEVAEKFHSSDSALTGAIYGRIPDSRQQQPHLKRIFDRSRASNTGSEPLKNIINDEDSLGHHHPPPPVLASSSPPKKRSRSAGAASFFAALARVNFDDLLSDDEDDEFDSEFDSDDDDDAAVSTSQPLSAASVAGAGLSSMPPSLSVSPHCSLGSMSQEESMLAASSLSSTKAKLREKLPPAPPLLPLVPSLAPGVPAPVIAVTTSPADRIRQLHREHNKHDTKTTGNSTRDSPDGSPSPSHEAYFSRPSPERIEAYTADVVDAVRRGDVPLLRSMLRENDDDGSCPRQNREQAADGGETARGTVLRRRRRFDCCNRFGESLLHTACRRGRVDVARFLLAEAGVDLRSARDDYGRTPFHDACWTSGSGPSVELMDVLLEHAGGGGGGRREAATAAVEMLLVKDVRGHIPFDYARREHWEGWNRFIEERKEVLFSCGDGSANGEKMEAREIEYVRSYEQTC